MADPLHDAREPLLLPVDDYLAATAHLSCEQHGALFLLICHAWQKGVLPSGDRELAAITKMARREWQNSRGVLLEFFRDGMPPMLAGDAP